MWLYRLVLLLCPYFPQTNTYQGIVIVSGIEAYTIFTYMCGDIQWSTIGTESAVVGYNAKGGYTHNVHGSSLSSIGELVSCTVSAIVQSKRETAPAELTLKMASNPALKLAFDDCKNAVDDDETLFSIGGCIPDDCDPNQIISEVEPCPCTSQQAENDCRFTRDNLISLNKMCFIQKIPHFRQAIIRVEFVQQCCYNPDTG